MAFFDLPPEKLRTYRATETAPRDFDSFWKKTLAQAEEHPLTPRLEKLTDSIYRNVEAYDLTFHGYDGQDVKGWLIFPAQTDLKAKLPCLVTYIGYGGGRSFALDHVSPTVAGFAHLVMDTRGQGSNWAHGDTPDNAGPLGGAPAFPGFMTRGIESPYTYYYRRVYTDAARAVEVAATHPRIDPKRIGVTGGSQGGGITLAAAGLCGKKVKIAMPDVPYLCHFRRATTLVDSSPYSEIAYYLKSHRDKIEQVYRTLAYFDGMHFAPRITARCLFSVGLMDTICPPSTVYAAYNWVRGKKEIKVYDYNNHEGGGAFQAVERLRFAAQHL